MNSKRFYDFIKSEKTQSRISFILYILFIIMHTSDSWPTSLQNIYLIVFMIILCPIITIYMIMWLEFDEVYKKTGNNIIKIIKNLIIEFAMFIPFLFISAYIISSIFIGKPANQASVNSLGASSIYNMITIIISGPIFEEFIFRLLPYKFIKNKALYIIISAFIFSGIHVINDTNPLYYIWCYMPTSLYYGYRYHKTNSILVTISLHILNNLLSMLPIILLYFN